MDSNPFRRAAPAPITTDRHDSSAAALGAGAFDEQSSVTPLHTPDLGRYAPLKH
jgi:hypothetical protein